MRLQARTFDYIVRNGGFDGREHTIIYQKASLFKKADLPLHDNDYHRLLKIYGRVCAGGVRSWTLQSDETIVNKINDKQAKHKVFTIDQRSAVFLFEKNQFDYDREFINADLSKSPWKFNDIRLLKKKAHGNLPKYELLFQDGDGTELVVTPRQVLSGKPTLGSQRLIKRVGKTHEDVESIFKSYVKGSTFPQKLYDRALTNGYFNPESRMVELDGINLLREKNLPLPSSLRIALKKNNDKVERYVKKEYKLASHTLEMLTVMVSKDSKAREKISNKKQEIERISRKLARVRSTDQVPVKPDNIMGLRRIATSLWLQVRMMVETCNSQLETPEYQLIVQLLSLYRLPKPTKEEQEIVSEGRS